MSERYSIMPLSALRKVIAVRMTDAKRTIPHFRLSMDAEVDSLLQLREQMCASNPGAVVSVNDLLIKVCARALMDVPAVNIQWAETEIRQFHSADISIVTALERGGLATPIVRGAESKSIWEISREVKALAERAACNTLQMHEVFGGSFTLSNLGMYGVDQFDAIINPPQCAILAVAAAKPRVLACPGRTTRIATILRLTLSVDHRALDGVTAAMFLAAVRRRIELPSHLASAAVGELAARD